ncbi:MAG: class D sortase [Acidobacteria bacterium]|nr:class D sortase [Acidobacteriota bacterium]
MRNRDRRWIGWIERALWAAGAGGVLWIGAQTMARADYNATHQAALATAPREPLGDTSPPATVPPDGVIGVLEIPRLKYSQVVTEGDNEATLKIAVGHLPDTPLPWRPGNSVVAGHRDTHFRALRAIRHDDEIRLRTPYGVLTYRVRDRMIVAPADVWVLAPSTRRQLTLVTCYPFTYVGSAPQRFIVRAAQTAGP